MRCRVHRARALVVALVLALAATASGCGGGSGPSKQGYYAALDGFCGKVAAAAARVSQDTVAVRKDTGASRASRRTALIGSLKQWADATDSALRSLEQTGAPSAFSGFQHGTSTGYRAFATALRNTATQSEKDPNVLAQLQSRVTAAVKLLPGNLPKDIAANARTCTTLFSPATG